MPEVFDATKNNKQTSTIKDVSSNKQTSQNQVNQEPSRPITAYSEVIRKEKPNNNPFSSFAALPRFFAFESQHESEQVALLLRKHPIVNIPWIIISILMVFAPLILLYVPLISFLPWRFQFITIVGWYILIIVYIIESFLAWFFDVFIITDERIIDIDFASLIYKRVSATKIDNIEDITISTGGWLRSFVDFGSVHVQTAAEQREFEIKDVPHPGKVTKLLNELLLEEEREKIEGRTH